MLAPAVTFCLFCIQGPWRRLAGLFCRIVVREDAFAVCGLPPQQGKGETLLVGSIQWSWDQGPNSGSETNKQETSDANL